MYSNKPSFLILINKNEVKTFENYTFRIIAEKLSIGKI